MIELLIALTVVAANAVAGPRLETIPDNPCPEGWQYVMSEVRGGEGTVAAVAARLRVTPEKLAGWNDFPSDARLSAGQTIFLCRDLRPGSVGYPWRGSLRGGVNIDSNGDGRGCGWVTRRGRIHTWGTPETVAAVSDCLCRYRTKFPDGPDISLGDMSRQNGRRLSRHLSHQSGRDVDLGYVTNPPQTDGHFNRWAGRRNLDVEKQWWILKCFLDRGNVQFMFMNWQSLTSLRRFVESVPEYRSYLDYFPGGTRPILVNDPSHKSHVHIRFTCPVDDSDCRDRR